MTFNGTTLSLPQGSFNNPSGCIGSSASQPLPTGACFFGSVSLACCFLWCLLCNILFLTIHFFLHPPHCHRLLLLLLLLLPSPILHFLQIFVIVIFLYWVLILLPSCRPLHFLFCSFHQFIVCSHFLPLVHPNNPTSISPVIIINNQGSCQT